MFGAKAQPASFLGDFCNKICQLRPDAPQQKKPLFDHLIGEREQLLGSLQAERLGCFQIDYQLEFGRRLHREVGWLGTLENAVDVPGRLSRLFGIIAAIADQPTRLRTIGGKIDRRNAVSRGQLDDQLAIGDVESVR